MAARCAASRSACALIEISDEALALTVPACQAGPDPHGQAKPGRNRAGHSAVELSLSHGRQFDRACAARRQRRHFETCRATLLVGERFQAAMDLIGAPKGLFANLILDHESTARLIASCAPSTMPTSAAWSRVARRWSAPPPAPLPRSVSNSAARTPPMCVRTRPSNLRSRTLSTAHSSIPANAAAGSSASTRTKAFTTASSMLSLNLPRDTNWAIRWRRRRRSARWRRVWFAQTVRDHTARLAKGARALVDRARFPADAPGTPYLMPQVLTGVDHSMRVMVDESFGFRRWDYEGSFRRRGDRADERQSLWPDRVDLDFQRAGG